MAMKSDRGLENNWVFFEVADHSYAVQTQYVIEMTLLGKVEKIPKAPDSVRGVVNLRGEVFPVIDLRMWLGMNSRVQEKHDLMNLLRDRKQDHLNWLDELVSCVDEGREFELTTDPHQCKFGQWYDNFDTDNATLRHALMRFDKPHKAIHLVGKQATARVKDGDIEGAKEMIKATKERDLVHLVKLFDETIQLVDDEDIEIVIVMDVRDRKIGLIVDSVVSVSEVDPEKIETAAEAGIPDTSLIQGVYSPGDTTYLMIEASTIVNEITGSQTGEFLQAHELLKAKEEVD